jgi:hypothetical protein
MEGHRLRVFGNRIVQKIFKFKREKLDGAAVNCVTRGVCQVLFGFSSEGR